MAKKLEGNGMWESSRMMLPEHVDGINAHRRTLGAKERPVLDEQKLQDISERIGESLHNGTDITLVTFNEFQDREYTGRVLQVDQQGRRVKLSDSDFEYIWIKFDNIIDAR